MIKINLISKTALFNIPTEIIKYNLKALAEQGVGQGANLHKIVTNDVTVPLSIIMKIFFDRQREPLD